MLALVHCKVELSVSTMFTFLSQDYELRCLSLLYKGKDQHSHLWRGCLSMCQIPLAACCLTWPGLTTQYLRQGGWCIVYYSCCQISTLLRYWHSQLAFLLNFLERLNLSILNQPNLYGSFHVCFPWAMIGFRIPHFISFSTQGEELQQFLLSKHSYSMYPLTGIVLNSLMPTAPDLNSIYLLCIMTGHSF